MVFSEFQVGSHFSSPISSFWSVYAFFVLSSWMASISWATYLTEISARSLAVGNEKIIKKETKLIRALQTWETTQYWGFYLMCGAIITNSEWFICLDNQLVLNWIKDYFIKYFIYFKGMANNSDSRSPSRDRKDRKKSKSKEYSRRRHSKSESSDHPRRRSFSN